MAKPPVWYNRCNSAVGIVQSVIGEAGAVGGTPSYVAGKFENATYSDAVADYIVANPGIVGLSVDNWTWTSWIKTDYSSTNGVPSDNQIHDFFNVSKDTSTNDWTFGFLHSSLGFRYYDKNGGAIKVDTYFKTGLTWAAATWTHFAIVVDKAGIDGTGDYIRFYINGAEVIDYTSAIGTSANAMNEINLFRYVPTSGAGGFDGALCNAKIYDYAKTDFTDIENERGDLNDQLT